MPLNPQTSAFPPLSPGEQSWDQTLAKSMELLAPSSGVRAGLKLGLPLSGIQPTTGLLPTLEDGLLLQSDDVVGPYGSQLISAAPKNVANRRLYYGVSGMYWAGVDNAPRKAADLLIGEVTTDNNVTPSIVSVGQAYNYGACQFGIRGVFNLAALTDGADQAFFTWKMPLIGLDYVRIAHAQCRVVAPVTAGGDTGDDFILKLKVDAAASISLATISATGLGAAGTVSRGTPDDADPWSWFKPSNLVFQYNQTDGTTAIAGGMVEAMIRLECF
ncbi:hypothetical protein H6F43_03940 [Leptolyngbya sp. FACHB-36]|uniref:hypothetical protein n=1 Tax=Leptolyngbya sp. FACHB-36 TaxID=2692808 RepID=UPI0016802A70|nr:hypothetical protein [Leptolyngbya sp. FACHB-36]MBD2019334.1 hypothetical protein [Leptolyngbya sp. FACHB-36]